MTTIRPCRLKTPFSPKAEPMRPSSGRSRPLLTGTLCQHGPLTFCLAILRQSTLLAMGTGWSLVCSWAPQSTRRPLSADVTAPQLARPYLDLTLSQVCFKRRLSAIMHHVQGIMVRGQCNLCHASITTAETRSWACHDLCGCACIGSALHGSRMHASHHFFLQVEYYPHDVALTAWLIDVGMSLCLGECKVFAIHSLVSYPPFTYFSLQDEHCPY